MGCSFRVIAALLLGLAMSPAFAGDVVDGTTVVFVCEHGNAKSLIAATLFDQEAARRHLPFHAVARGVKPGQGVPSSIATSLRNDGHDVSGFIPKPIAAADLQAALRVVLLNLDRSAIPGSDPHKTDTWSGIPPAETDYPKANDAIAERIASLLQQLEHQQ